MLADLRHAAMRLRAAPISTLVASACLAFGLAAAMIVYSVTQDLILRPTTIPAAADVRVLELDLTAGATQQRLSHWSYPAFVALRDALAPEFAAIAVTSDPLWLTFSHAAGSQRIRTEIVEPGYFSALGLTPLLGADVGANAAAEDRRVWITHSFWRDQFGADGSVVGKVVQLQGIPFVVAGVMPAGFQGISEQAASFIPMSAAPSVTFARRLASPTSFWHSVLVVPTAGSEPALSARLEAAAPQVRDVIDMRVGGEQAQVSIASTAWTETRVDPVLRQTTAAVIVGVALLLAIVAVNLILLALARQDQRRREMGVRISLGANRAALLRVVTSEMLLLSAAGLLGAWLLTLTGLRFLAGFDELVSVGGLSLADVRIGAATVLFGIGLAGAVVLAVLIGPARATLALSAAAAVRSSSGAPALHGRRWLAGTQFALATILAIGAGVAALSAWRALQVPLGFDPERLLTSQVSIPAALTPADGIGGFVTRLNGALAALPGVERAATAACLPVRGGCDNVNLEAVPRTAEVDWPVGLNMIAGDYFGALGVPLLEGRFLDARDSADAAPVVVLSASAARRYFPQGSALGQKVSVTIGFPEDPAGATVVGVVGDVFGADLDADAAPMVYLSALQSAYNDNLVIVQARPGVDAQSLVPALASTLRQEQPELALWDTATMEQRFASLTARRSLVASLIAALAGLSVVLAGTGVFAVFDLLVRRRQREFGVRLALGASAGTLRKVVLADALVTAAVATLVGLVIGVGVLQLLATELPGVDAAPAPVFAAVAALMVAIAVLASWWPARRAARTNPLDALRQEA